MTSKKKEKLEKKDDPSLRSNIVKRGGPETDPDHDEVETKKSITEKFGVNKSAKILME